MTDTVLVTGATGDIGSKLVRSLQDSGADFRVMCRRQAQIEQFRSRGVDAVHGDFDRPATLLDAMQDIGTLFLLTLPGPSQRAHGRDAVDMAVRAGVQRIVHLGAQDADLDSPVPWAAAPAETDELVRASGLRWTLVQPTAFMQNLAQSAATIKRGFIPQTTGQGVAGWIDTGDIARVAHGVLTGNGHDGAAYVLTGPELLSIPDIAAIMTDVLRRRVRYLHLPGAVFETAMRLGGASAWQARGMREQFADALRHGKYGIDELTTTVGDLTGTPPRPFREYVVENRSVFTP